MNPKNQIKYLPRLVDPPKNFEKIGGAKHPFRKLTEDLLFEEQTQSGTSIWSSELAKDVAKGFDEAAPNWEARFFPGELDGISDALERGEVPSDISCIELGAGTGLGTKVLTKHCRTVVAVDISMGMLALQPPHNIRIQADAGCLPFQDNSTELVALINMFLFPAEVDRILKPGGRVLWFSSLGDDTPIYLPASKVLEAFLALKKVSTPASKKSTTRNWSAIAGRVNRAEWCVLRT